MAVAGLPEGIARLRRVEEAVGARQPQAGSVTMKNLKKTAECTGAVDALPRDPSYDAANVRVLRVHSAGCA